MNIKKAILGGLLILAGFVAAGGRADAQTVVPGADFSISCENGGNYTLRSGPVLAPGQIVVASLHLSPRHVVPVRLIPMGDGYRYAGRGVWLDGIRDHALLYLNKYNPTACLVGRI
ncbi:hypothetical protein [Rhodopseudomonas palustris]|uniref:hypothetical protein n=1 Tax=Rhodopseudomonas palustris TaxID=1076 RepID=UPI00059F5E7F|nr:hypothetical protein [Rhodopseudomonas palustris]